MARGRDGRHAVLGAGGIVAAALLSAGLRRVRAERLRDAARSLLPPDVEVVDEREGDCVELALSPSCVHVRFVWAADLDTRMAAVESSADTSGWTREWRELLPGGAHLRFRRGRFAANVHLRRDAAGEPDAVLVERAG